MIGSELRALRLKAGLLQTTLAQQLNVTQSLISRVENGAATTTEVIEAWVTACGGRIKIESVEGESGAYRYVQRLLPRLSEDDMRRLAMIVAGMPDAEPSFKEGIAAAFFALAPAETRTAFQQAAKAG